MKVMTIVIISLLVILFSCDQKQAQTEEKAQNQIDRIFLWNGDDFSGLQFYLEDSTVAPETVWMIREDVIHCTGVPSGYIYTQREYADYRLHLEWRWAEEPGNSGVLLHTQQPDQIWPKCIEAQLKSGNAGDFYLIGGTSINEQQNKDERRVAKKQASSEKPAGEWNSYDITCNGDSIILTVNGVLQNTASGASVVSGKICLQSEGKPIQFRNFYLDPLN
jgi:hypothetical protein